MAWALNIDKVDFVAWKKNVFTPETCKKIIKFGKSRKPEAARVDVIKPRKDKKVRDSKVVFLLPHEIPDVYRILTDTINELNEKFFKFKLTGFFENIQFTEYKAPGGHYGRHIDRALGSVARKLSVTVQLSDPKDYKGGDLNLYVGENPYVCGREQGIVNVFPSYVLHEVQPVTKGTRYSLVAWICGPDFK
jgi:PKHD-type hydroxylase